MHKDSKVIEEYWGIWSAYNKSASQWPVDSVIHALGDVRSEAKDAVAQADVIITSGVAVAAHWRAWSMSINYWFYGDIFKNRTADFVSPTTVVWRKIDKPRYNQPIDCIISDDKASISVNSIAHKYYAVTLNYQFNGSGRLLLMAQNNISSTNGRELGFFPIPPETGTISYPILTTQDGVNNFAFLPIGGKNMTITINTCDANELTDVVFDALNLSAGFYLTDRNWIHGVGRSHAGFFVPNERSYINRYQIGKYVLFPNGYIRKIISVKPFSQYLNIEVEGAVLDAERVGLPLKFKVLDKPPL